ncbi:glyoxalase [Pacificimonas flava]|uniref:Glyoxalase n=2 Tax=Pacificimonas TaxID=1960290 RepID=A0A219B0Q9_9SPHN|nr:MULTISPECIES: VOC family protein [Pacificimonas]OWV31932.1 glyoxalase [Pacificimonas flava]
MSRTNSSFEFRGVNHIALVCKDMAETVRFYRDTLGMPLMKTLDLPGDGGQHFFFDVGNGDCIAFFWFPRAPERAPGIASPAALPTKGDFSTAHGSLNHIAINISAEKFDEYVDRLVERGVEISAVLNHDHSPTQVSADVNDDTWIRSVYFFDPDGVCLELAAWTMPIDESHVRHDPVDADGRKVEGLVVES